MRFARVYIRKDTGEVVNVTEQETPFDQAGISVHAPFEIEMHELGFVEDFDPTAIAGGRCSPARHLFERIESSPGDADGRPWRAKLGHDAEVPAVLDCPTSLEGIKERLRTGGPDAIPAKARAWLALMLPPDTVAAMGIARRLPISALKAVESIRVRRDPLAGSRLMLLERVAKRIEDSRRARIERRAAKGG